MQRRAAGWLAGIGRWCFRQRWLVLAVWLVAVAAGGVASGPLNKALEPSGSPGRVESNEAYDVLAEATGSSGDLVGLVDRVDPDADAVRTAVEAAAADLGRRADVRGVRTPYAPGEPPDTAAQYRAGDGRALLVVVTLTRVDGAERADAVTEVTDRLHRLADELRRAGENGATVAVGGRLAVERQTAQTIGDDLARAEAVSLPITLLVLVVVFGGLVAAGLPVVAAVVSVASAMSVLFGFTKVVEVDSHAMLVTSLLGLGLSIDYALLLVGRYREELLAGHEPPVAVERAWASAGRTIVFSALTVATAIAGLLVIDVPPIAAVGAAGVSIALVAMLVSLTLTAALLGLFGRRIRPSRRARSHAQRGRGLFERLAGLVQRRPLAVALATSALLVAAAVPALGTRITLPGLDDLPDSVEAVGVSQALASRFGRLDADAVTVVARTDPATLDSWVVRWRDDRTVAAVGAARPVGGGLAVVDLAVRGEADGTQAQSLIRRLRADRPSGVESWVTGPAATLIDVNARIRDGLPAAVAVTLLATAVLLFLMTGSVVIPVKAILANLVSLGAALGVMNAVFVEGWLAGPLQVSTVDGFEPFIVVIVVSFAFALSLDYEVFLLGRITEYADGGDDTDTAVRRALQHTGRIVTSAALLMVVVFASFAAGTVNGVEQVGLGLAVAVVIDATVVRCLLVPASMTLLGRWNWWPGAFRPARRSAAAGATAPGESGEPVGAAAGAAPAGGDAVPPVRAVPDARPHDAESTRIAALLVDECRRATGAVEPAPWLDAAAIRLRDYLAELRAADQEAVAEAARRDLAADVDRVSAEAVLDRAEADLAGAQADLAGAQADLDRLRAGVRRWVTRLVAGEVVAREEANEVLRGLGVKPVPSRFRVATTIRATVTVDGVSADEATLLANARLTALFGSLDGGIAIDHAGLDASEIDAVEIDGCEGADARAADSKAADPRVAASRAAASQVADPEIADGAAARTPG